MKKSLIYNVTEIGNPAGNKETADWPDSWGMMYK